MQAPVNLKPMHNQALHEVANIFILATKDSMSSKGETALPRVSIQSQSSHDMIEPKSFASTESTSITHILVYQCLQSKNRQDW